jgi:hypothetical protein
MSRALPRNRWDLVAQRLAASCGHEYQSIATCTDVVNDGFLRATKGVVAKYFTQYGEIRQTKNLITAEKQQRRNYATAKGLFK